MFILCVCVCVTEASYTLLLYDELLEWSDRPLREFLNYPMQSEWQRKEYLHLTIVQNFDRGKVSLSTRFFSPHTLFLYIIFIDCKTERRKKHHVKMKSFCPQNLIFMVFRIFGDRETLQSECATSLWRQPDSLRVHFAACRHASLSCIFPNVTLIHTWHWKRSKCFI